ncbi:MAG TPA: ATP-binding protein [Saprospiraceae bacterium]|nr:ATP-binding protein [Saprospiraceae bacterium]
MTLTYLPRNAEKEIIQLTKQFPAVAIVGPRQVGKTSLARYVADALEQKSIYLDLESPGDLNKLSDPELYLGSLPNLTVILDEVQRVPGLFPVLRGLIDKRRVPGRFILLGSASPELIQDASESLAGRIAYFEMNPFSFSEVSQKVDFRTHWLRGGFPNSLLAEDDKNSTVWREHFIQSYLERDLPLLGLNANPILTRRLWTMLAHWNGNLLKYESLSNSLGISGPTVRKYIDFFESAYLVRRIQPWFTNIPKRIVKSPKIYIRDTGILHTLLSIDSFDQLQGSPGIGASWEAYIVQEIASILPPRYELCFYRTQDGTEADLVLIKAGVPDKLVEIKYSSAPTVTKGMRIAAIDLQTRRNVIVAPVAESYPIGDGYEVLSNLELHRLFE